MLKGNVRAHDMLLERHTGRIIAAARYRFAKFDSRPISKY
jgi:hypothetical protein